jgi:hypothetical protein
MAMSHGAHNSMLRGMHLKNLSLDRCSPTVSFQGAPVLASRGFWGHRSSAIYSQPAWLSRRLGDLRRMRQCGALGAGWDPGTWNGRWQAGRGEHSGHPMNASFTCLQPNQRGCWRACLEKLDNVEGIDIIAGVLGWSNQRKRQCPPEQNG